MSRSGSNGRRRSQRQQIDDKVEGPLNVAIDTGGGEHPNAELFEAAIEQLESLTGQVTLTRRDNILSHLLFREVDRLFESGWRPNELAHCAAQRLEAAERRLLLMAIGIHALMNNVERRAPSEWVAQLVDLRVDELDLDVNRRPGIIAEWRIAEDFAGAAVWRHGLRLIAHITSLASLPYVCAPPRLWDSAVDLDPDLAPPASLSEIRELLRPVEVARTFAEARDHIASALMAAAQHGFDTALADVNDPVILVHQVRSRRVLINGPGVDSKTALLHVVCESNGVRAVCMPGFAMSAIVGRPADLDVSTLLYESLVAHCERAFRWESSESAGGVADHIERCTRAVVDMLEGARSAVEQAVYAAHGSYGIRVLAQREAASDIVSDAMFPDLLYQLSDDVA